jgi:hypothetical protein
VSTIAPVLLGALVAIFGVPGAGWAAETPADATVAPGANAVEVRIGAVLASNSGKEFDPRLVAMHRQFSALFPYSSYRLVKEQRQQVPWGAKVGFDIPGGRYVLVIPKEYRNGRISMKVVLIDGARQMIDTVLSLRDHATFLVGGPHHDDGVLILSIGADTLR